MNWDERTAQLHLSVGNYVALRFDAKTGDDMRRLATQYVEVRGRGRFDSTGSWTMVRVEKISSTRSGEEPFDLDEFSDLLRFMQLENETRTAQVLSQFDSLKQHS